MGPYLSSDFVLGSSDPSGWAVVFNESVSFLTGLVLSSASFLVFSVMSMKGSRGSGVANVWSMSSILCFSVVLDAYLTVGASLPSPVTPSADV